MFCISVLSLVTWKKDSTKLFLEGGNVCGYCSTTGVGLKTCSDMGLFVQNFQNITKRNEVRERWGSKLKGHS